MLEKRLKLVLQVRPEMKLRSDQMRRDSSIVIGPRALSFAPTLRGGRSRLSRTIGRMINNKSNAKMSVMYVACQGFS